MMCTYFVKVCSYSYLLTFVIVITFFIKPPFTQGRLYKCTTLVDIFHLLPPSNGGFFCF